MAQARIGVVRGATLGVNHLRRFRQLGHLGVVAPVGAVEVNQERLEEHQAKLCPDMHTDYTEMLGKCRSAPVAPAEEPIHA